MATSMWRMNGLCRKMAGLLVLCTLLLSSVVICQEPATEPPTTIGTSGNDPANPTAPQQDATTALSVGSEQLNATSVTSTNMPGNSIQEITDPAIAGSDALAVKDPDSSNNVNASKPEGTNSPSSSDSSVFVGLLVSGLLAALGITTGYFYCQRRSNTKGMKLTDEAFPADQENQGSTLASVAPLNPPPETQEKPSVNGESPEAAKTQPPPPTNGHSTTKTADTEL